MEESSNNYISNVEIKSRIRTYLEWEASDCFGCGNEDRNNDNIRIVNTVPMNSYRYIVTILKEKRHWEQRCEPFDTIKHGAREQFPQGEHEGRTLWEIKAGPSPAATNPSILQAIAAAFNPDQSQRISFKVELPETRHVVDCLRCNAVGFVTCAKCAGSGFTRCNNCNGTGRVTTSDSFPSGQDLTTEVRICVKCLSTGRLTCSSPFCNMGRTQCTQCMSKKALVIQKVLAVQRWERNKFCTSRPSEIPMTLMEKAECSQILKEKRTSPPVNEVLQLPQDPSLSQKAKKYVEDVLRKEQNEGEKVMEIRHKIGIVPVLLVQAEVNMKEVKCYVFGKEKTLHFPLGIPAQNSNCCSIV